MKTLTALSILVLINYTCTAQLPAYSVSLFKDGSAFIVKSGSVSVKNKTALLDKEDPDAAFGSLWFTSGKNNLFSVSSYVDTIPVLHHTNDMIGELLGQIGTEATVYWGEAIESVSGTIVDIKTDHLQIKTQDKWINILLSQIHRVDFSAASPARHHKRESKRIIMLNFTDDAASQNVNMMYLRKDLGWFPEYKVLLSEGKTAQLTFNAVIVNDAENLNNASFNFVVGSPNFKFSHVNNPLSGKESLAQLLQQLNMGGGGYAPAVLANRAMSFGSEGMSFDNASGSVPSEIVSGSSKEDLYYYSLPKISSKKGSRTSFNIFTTDVPVSHVYRTHLPANNPGGNYYQQSFSFTDDHLNDVWHAIKLENTSKHPWTTAPAMVLKKEGNDSYPICQDILNYTSIKDDVFIKLTLAPDVSVKDSEKEISRKANDKREQNVSYDLVTIEGKIEIENFKKASIDLELQRNITGWMKESSKKWEVTSMLSPYGRINKSNKIDWKLNVSAGEKLTIVYTYDIYIRN